MNDNTDPSVEQSHPGRVHRPLGRPRRSRLPEIIGIGLTLVLAAGACTSESASTWTAAPVADDPLRTPLQEQGGPPGAAATEPAQEPPTPGRAQPLEPPAGNVIPRFVESERADQPDAADAIPAPIAVEPDTTPSATDAPAGTSSSAPPPSIQGTPEPSIEAVSSNPSS